MTEPTNAHRAEWARNALNTFTKEAYAGRTVFELMENHAEVTASDPGEKGDTDFATSIADLIANLIHLADENGIDGKDQVRRALSNYDEETECLSTVHIVDAESWAARYTGEQLPGDVREALVEALSRKIRSTAMAVDELTYDIGEEVFHDILKEHAPGGEL